MHVKLERFSWDALYIMSCNVRRGRDLKVIHFVLFLGFYGRGLLGFTV
jgi:hypothetical protein